MKSTPTSTVYDFMSYPSFMPRNEQKKMLEVLGQDGCRREEDGSDRCVDEDRGGKTFTGRR